MHYIFLTFLHFVARSIFFVSGSVLRMIKLQNSVQRVFFKTLKQTIIGVFVTFWSFPLSYFEVVYWKPLMIQEMHERRQWEISDFTGCPRWRYCNRNGSFVLKNISFFTMSQKLSHRLRWPWFKKGKERYCKAIEYCSFLAT